ncbi:MAG: SurA N-terminal domain-containing protein [Minicystis sp.]
MNKLTSVLGAAAVIAIAVVFILQFRPASNAGRTDSGPTCAVEVHGTCAVTANEFQAAYRLVAWNFDPARLKAMGLRRHVADGLLERWVLNQDAKRLGISISDEELTAELAHGRAHVSLPAGDLNPMTSVGRNLGLGEDSIRLLPVKNPKTKKYDAKVYDKQVRQISRLSTPDFRAFQKEEIVAARMRDLVRGRVRVGENEAYDQYARDKSSATLDYVRFDRRFYADLAVDQSPKAVEAWAEAHKEDLDKVWESRKAQILPECRSVREIMVKLDGTTASDDEKAKAKARIERAKERLAKGEDFAEVARSMSDGTTANRGGENRLPPQGQGAEAAGGRGQRARRRQGQRRGDHGERPLPPQARHHRQGRRSREARPPADGPRALHHAGGRSPRARGGQERHRRRQGRQVAQGRARAAPRRDRQEGGAGRGRQEEGQEGRRQEG